MDGPSGNCVDGLGPGPLAGNCPIGPLGNPGDAGRPTPGVDGPCGNMAAVFGPTLPLADGNPDDGKPAPELYVGVVAPAAVAPLDG